jgi:hypothetical protein
MKKYGYLMLTMVSDEGEPTKLGVHRAVLLAFRGDPGPGMHAAHLDGDPTNNHLSNLAWLTPLENNRMRRTHGTMPVGVRSGTAKLTPEQVLQLRIDYAVGEGSQRKLAAKYGVSQRTVNRIVRRQTWTHV